eukprot:Unigene7118_Nuclearia_a/m.21826 Unigene7118_Nuclearia_a/g.21826  ORF Unigene7118_Nuclearia_a/g.21826 Unigene7118_Nuclearia_a/m.21826 type:complete len:437 (-) Unigene7118_Nuclearia_a:62-1372(-)
MLCNQTPGSETRSYRPAGVASLTSHTPIDSAARVTMRRALSFGASASFAKTTTAMAGTALAASSTTSTLHEPASQQQAAAEDSDRVLEEATLAARLFGWMWSTSEKHAYDAESGLLARVRDPLRRRLVPVGAGSFINTVELGSHATATPDSPARTVVLCHGFGAGLGHWYRQLDALAAVPGLKTYAIDWLGFGRSSRPSFLFVPGKEGSVEKSEAFFVDSLEAWREANKIDRFILVGHSLGGYLAAVYALKHPDKVQHLVLVSPVGVPELKEDPLASLTQAPWRQRMFVSTVVSLWNWGASPQMILRMPALGRRFVNGYAARRFPSLPPDEVELLREYTFHISVRRGSGEYAANTLLQFPVYARSPLAHRLPRLTMPTTFLYGKYDWMDATHAYDVAPHMHDATVHTLDDAGHFLFLENTPQFNKLLLSAVRRSPL